MTEKEEQIQRNCEQIQQLLDRYPNRNITVIRTNEDYCYIKEKKSKKVIYTGETKDTLQELRRYLEPTQEEIKTANDNYNKIQELIKRFPKGTLEVIRININYYQLIYKDEYTETNWIFNTGATFVNLGDMLKYRVGRNQAENELLAETQALLNKSKYNWLEIRKTKAFEHWQVIDKNNNKVHFEGRADRIVEKIKEITQNQ